MPDMHNRGKRKMQSSACTILITGASSGIGKALALYYAKRAYNLVLWGRNAERLKETGDECSAMGAKVHLRQIDMLDGDHSIKAYFQDDAAYRIEKAILCAGMGDMKLQDQILEDPHKVWEVGLVNYASSSALATAAAQCMIKRNKGAIALIGSVASFHTLPIATAYSASKKGLDHFSKALRLALSSTNISVTMIHPGFVDTPMSQRLKTYKPGVVKVDKAAERIARAIELKKKELVFPRFFLILKYIDIFMPKKIKNFILLSIKAEV